MARVRPGEGTELRAVVETAVRNEWVRRVGYKLSNFPTNCIEGIVDAVVSDLILYSKGVGGSGAPEKVLRHEKGEARETDRAASAA